MSNLFTQDAIQDPYNVQHLHNLSDSGNFYHSGGQFYLDTHEAYNNPSVAKVTAIQNGNPTHGQPNFKRRQTDLHAKLPQMPYTPATIYPDETIRDRNIRSQAYIDEFEPSPSCFKNADHSQPGACVGTINQQ